MKSLAFLSTGFATLALAGLSTAAHAQGSVTAKPVPSGAMQKIGFYAPQRLTLTGEKPAGVKKLPDGLTAPQYGVLKFGPADKPANVIFVLDEADGGSSRIFVDSNANGDLTDDPAVPWTPAPYKSRSGTDLKRHMGQFTIVAPGGSSYALNMYKFDPKDPDRAALKDILLYFRDYAVEGTLTLGGKPYRFMLDDGAATGDFSRPTGVNLLIDVNGNGEFDRRGEIYPVGKPFNIGGTTYEIKGIDPTGARFTVDKSATTVAEVLPPPDLSPGKKVIPFTVKTTAGETVKFPETYKGKVVLLDFWATWCGPCIAELPYLTAAYQKFNGQGFEVLGISLDQANAEQKLATFTKDKGMPWPQVYDGKFWEAEIAQLYTVQAIPAAYLVDGDTGEILATGPQLRGPNLEKAIAKALERKGKKVGVTNEK